jgi:nicotinamidase-related amidase
MGHLIDPEDCVLAVIDVQPGFLARVENGDDLVQRIAFLAISAQFCAIPVIATVESPESWGPLDPRLAGHAAVRKEVFGLADDPLAGPAVRDTGRETVVLTGLETDVCVAHSALGLLDSGRRVVVVEDAVGSPGAAHGSGLERMRRAGVVSVVTKQLHYEWMRTVERSRAFTDAHPGLAEPPGVLL